MDPLAVTLTRASVCPGDDCDAPHYADLDLPATATLGDALAAVLARCYLPTIGGGQATWVWRGRTALAVTAQQWTAPRYLVPPATPLRDCLGPRLGLHADYECQRDPDALFAHLATPTANG